MKPTTKSVSAIHFVRASIAKKPGKEEIQQAIQRANQKYNTVMCRSAAPQIYTR